MGVCICSGIPYRYFKQLLMLLLIGIYKQNKDKYTLTNCKLPRANDFSQPAIINVMIAFDWLCGFELNKPFLFIKCLFSLGSHGDYDKVDPSIQMLVAVSTF